MATANLQTWDEIVASTMRSDKTLRESLQDAIANVAPSETPILSRLGQVPVDNTFVQWLIDTYRAATGNAILEDWAFTAYEITIPTRVSNIVQTFYGSGMVTDTSRDVVHAGTGDPLGYYEAKHVVELKKDIELALVKGSAITGTTGTANRLGGLMNIISTNKTNLSGVTLTEKVFNNILELTWSNTVKMPSEIYVTPKLKRTISLYSTKNTFNVDAASKSQTLVVDSYQNDFGTFRCIQHRNLNATAQDTQEFFGIDPTLVRTGWLSPLKREILSRDGLRIRFQMAAKLTLLYGNEKAFCAATNVQYYIP